MFRRDGLLPGWYQRARIIYFTRCVGKPLLRSYGVVGVEVRRVKRDNCVCPLENTIVRKLISFGLFMDRI